MHVINRGLVLINQFLIHKELKEINGPILVTGGAGFIGISLVENFLSKGVETHVLDNMSKGNENFVKKWQDDKNFKFFKIDLLEKDWDINEKYKAVFHLAADPEVRKSVTNSKEHFENNVLTTLNLLEKIKNWNIDYFVFTSTSTVYGEPKKLPTPESYSPLEPISPYGASKLACEALISSYAHLNGFRSYIFRLANIIGGNNTHGVIFDFIKKLTKNPKELEVLGDGKQSKSYLHVSDCITAIENAVMNSDSIVNYFNVGSEDRIGVGEIANLVVNALNLKNTKVTYTGGVDGGRGWKGDVKTMILDSSKLRKLGWKSKYNSFDSVKQTINEMLGK